MLSPLAEVTYGPVRSRRLGMSLGLNILPPHLKVCNFNCPYCQFSWTHVGESRCPTEAWPEPAFVADQLRARLQAMVEAHDPIDRLTFAGHGEPTLHPQFARIVELVRALRDELVPDVSMAILSNASTVARPQVRRGLAMVDERYMKLDAGDPMTLRRLNASPVPIDQIIDGLIALPGVAIQSLFLTDSRGRVDNTGAAALSAWMQALTRIRPREVHIYTIDREPALPDLQPARADRLVDIGRRVQAAGIHAEVFAPAEIASFA